MRELWQTRHLEAMRNSIIVGYDAENGTGLIPIGEKQGTAQQSIAFVAFMYGQFSSDKDDVFLLSTTIYGSWIWAPWNGRQKIFVDFDIAYFIFGGFSFRKYEVSNGNEYILEPTKLRL